MFCLCVRGLVGVRGSQLHLLGSQGQEEEEGKEAQGLEDFLIFCGQTNIIFQLLFQEKEEREKAVAAPLPPEENTTNSRDGVNSAEEIIELQDLRMSPIPSLRHRHNSKYYKEPGGKMALIDR